VCPGDEFHLTIKDGLNYEVVISEKITVNKVIDFIASFRFALEDGTCPGFHLMGVFACKSELPEELKNAVMLNDLTKKQYANFAKSVGVKLEKQPDNFKKLRDGFGFLSKKRGK
jgi:hypothetical protein